MVHKQLIDDLREAARRPDNFPEDSELMLQAAEAIEELLAVTQRQLLEIAVLSRPKK